MRRFENPQNGYVEEVGTASLVLTSILGPIYLAYRGAWFAALLYLLAAPAVCIAAMLVATHTTLLLFFPLALAGLYLLAFCLQPLMCTAYLRRGWKELRELSPSI